MILTSEVPLEFLKAAEKIENGSFKRLILIPDREQISGLGLSTYDLGMSFGLEVKRNLFNPWENLIKRFTDMILVVIGGLVALPLLTLIAIMIRLDSKGPLFYGHIRIGKNGTRFKAWKFRTMVPNANQVLEAYLESNPEMKREWEATFKLQNDPRVTRVGRILRKLSLDELPQVWNVLRGEMSLVGPRPIVNDEVKFYGDRYDLYSFVTPGITGLWQVSGRNNTTYEERVSLDEYYVRNWSIWMDIYILSRTIAVVLKREGAY
jgi:Undecaprenyl-phosphate galactose phosphotransferase WbaP